ncbi:MAG: YqjF family protein [Saprospiraceae bacterium]
MSFLTAEWRKLVFANYPVPADLLKPYVPPKTELDRWNDTVYVSLVGFMFVNVKLLGIKVPYHVNFPEVNLRLYVRYKDNGTWKRGVTFISEIVPRPAITFVANTVYKEHYRTRKMRHLWTTEGNQKIVQYEWEEQNDWQKIRVASDTQSIPLVEGSEEQFITEHYWGYAKRNASSSNQYEVRHPSWELYPVQQHEIECNFDKVYGEPFALLNQTSPTSIFLAEGSAISIESKTVI